MTLRYKRDNEVLHLAVTTVMMMMTKLITIIIIMIMIVVVLVPVFQKRKKNETTKHFTCIQEWLFIKSNKKTIQFLSKIS